MTLYWLGIDLGTTYTAAALCRPAADELETQVVPLSSRSHATPSVLFLAEDGSLVVGEVAQRRALTDPDRVVREFKRRIGDEIPLLVGGSPYHAHELAAKVVHRVWQRVVEREGELPEGVALTCPASWGPYKTSLFEQAVRDTGIGEVVLLSEPQAAAVSYASQGRVEVGARLAVYDLGGGTFDAAVVRKDSPATFTVLGRPEGIDGLGGVNFDEAIFEHVCAAAGVPVTEIDPYDPDIVAEVARLRRECTEAKEALSVDTDATIPAALGGVRQRVRVTRAEFEEMIRPELERTIEALRRALDSANIDSTQLDAILLIGGSSRIPLVSQLIAAEFDQAPAVDTDPKTAVAAGAARFLAPATAPVQETAETAFQLSAVPPERPQISTMLSGDEETIAEPARRRSRKALLSVAGVLLLLLAGAVTALRTPKLGDLFTHSTTSHGATKNEATTPGPSRPAGLAGTTPRSTAGPRGGSTTSNPAPSASSSHPATSGDTGTSSGPAPAPAHSSSTPAHSSSTPAKSSVHSGTPAPTPTQSITPSPTPTQSITPSPTPTQSITPAAKGAAG
jgi:molecular chaperone DnaK